MADVFRIRNSAAQMTRMAGALLLAALLFAPMQVHGQNLPPLARDLNPSETALILVDFQYPFTNTAGGNYRAVKKEIEEKQLLDRTVELVKKARSLGVWVIHVTEGYSNDYRELDPTNPGGFHRGQILRQAWKIGTEFNLTIRRSFPVPTTRTSCYRRASRPLHLAAPVSIKFFVREGSRTLPWPDLRRTCASMRP